MQRLDLSHCVGCGLCALECPADAIRMEKVKAGAVERRVPVVYYAYCVYCYHCVEACPYHVYQPSPEPPPATRSPEELNSLRLGRATF